MATELKNLKKGDTVILHMFTGIAVGVKEVLAADAKTVTIETRIGKAKFSKKDGVQVEPEAKSPRYANFITEDDGSFVPPERGKKKTEKKTSKKEAKKTKNEEPEEEEPEEEEAPAPKKEKKSEKKASPKKAAKKEPEDEDEDSDDEYEEVE